MNRRIDWQLVALTALGGLAGFALSTLLHLTAGIFA